METELVILTRTLSTEVQQKTILTLACMYLDYNLRARIIEFNKKSTDYRVRVNDYSQYNTEDDYEAGVTKLSAEIISGQIPDIFVTDGLPIKQYISKGLIKNLYDFMENDSEINKDTLVVDALRAFEVDGGLYQAVSSFYISTAFGLSEKVGTKPGWSLDELNAALAANPGAPPSPTPPGHHPLLCLHAGHGSVCGWQTGQCAFNSAGFIKLLEFANTFPAEIDYSVYEKGGSMPSDASRCWRVRSVPDVHFGRFQLLHRGEGLRGQRRHHLRRLPLDTGIGSFLQANGGLASAPSAPIPKARGALCAPSLPRIIRTTSCTGVSPPTRKRMRRRSRRP
jgi:hypothetical protein